MALRWQLTRDRAQVTPLERSRRRQVVSMTALGGAARLWFATALVDDFVRIAVAGARRYVSTSAVGNLIARRGSRWSSRCPATRESSGRQFAVRARSALLACREIKDATLGAVLLWWWGDTSAIAAWRSGRLRSLSFWLVVLCDIGHDVLLVTVGGEHRRDVAEDPRHVRAAREGSSCPQLCLGRVAGAESRKVGDDGSPG